VKIGKTRKHPFERAKQLSTGVAGDLEVIAYYTSMEHAKDEKKVHDKLKGKRIEGEHFDLSPLDAISRVRSTLNKEPSYICRKLQKPYEDIRNNNRRIMEARFGQERSATALIGAKGRRMQLSLEVDSLPLLDAPLCRQHDP
jgi:hypothetical protein